MAAGYDAACLALDVIAAIGMTLYWIAMPETGRDVPTPGLPRTGEMNR